jgi:spermidine synthase
MEETPLMAATIPLADELATQPAAKAAETKLWFYYVLFFLSGFPALLYQIVWQRALFTLFGANVESVTIVVTVFMLGLGLGSLAGGKLSAHPGMRLLAAFGCIELCVGAFGAASLPIFHRVASFTAGSSLTVTGIVAFALLLVPTLLMGSTLPLLSEHFVRSTGNVGESVGILYAVNTFGSGVACLAAAGFVMRMFGESGSVRLAVGFNLFVGTAALLLQRHIPTGRRRAGGESAAAQRRTIPLWIGMLLAGATGFIALAYEIVWFRLYSFVSGGRATTFALLLAMYLLGIAYGSLRVRDACKRGLRDDVPATLAACSEVVLIGAIAAFLLGPVLGRWIAHFNLIIMAPVFIAACLLGAAFPLLAHAAIDPAQDAGKGVSLLYLSNIIGSTAGSFLIGFVVFDHWSTRATSVLLLVLGMAVSAALAALAGPKARKVQLAAAGAVCVALAAASGPLFSGLYEQLLFKTTYRPGATFSDLMENRSGVIAVYTGTEELGYLTSTVYGGGMYDGRFNTGMLHDSNGLFRAFAVAGMHPAPRHVLMIGLSSGSWAQVAVNYPSLEDLTVVEINPGYLPLIRRYPEVESLLRNPKVHIVIDDGRRWLVAHPERRFDCIVMNTTFHWRANNTNLLSTEFLRLSRAHLNPGGILYYNTTWSPRVLATGITEYPYALRVGSFLAVSDSPFSLDKERWRSVLSAYRIDGRPVFDLSMPEQHAALDRTLHLADELDQPRGNLESRDSLLRRVGGEQIITDDNMGTEWQ